MAVVLSDYIGNGHKEELAKKILPMAGLLPLLATIELKDLFAAKLRNGWQPSVEMLQEQDLPLLKAGDMVKFISRGSLLAVAEMLNPVNNLSEVDGKTQVARIVRVFNN